LEYRLELAGVDPVVALVMSQEGLEGLLQHAPTALSHRWRSLSPCRYLHLQPSLIFGQLFAHDVLHRRSFVALLLRRLTSAALTFITNFFSPLLPLLVASYRKFGRWHVVEMAAHVISTQISQIDCWRWRCVHLTHIRQSGLDALVPLAN
jgi:hypothetical protein